MLAEPSPAVKIRPGLGPVPLSVLARTVGAGPSLLLGRQRTWVDRHHVLLSR